MVIRQTGRSGADKIFKAAADAQSVNLVGSRVYQTAEIKFLPVTTQVSMRSKFFPSAALLTAALLCRAVGDIVVPGANGTDGVLVVGTDTVIDLSKAVTAAWNSDNSANVGKGVYDASKWAVVFKYSDVNILSNATVTFKNHPSRAPGRCKKLSVISSPTAPSQPLRGRWSNGERSEPSATDPAGVGNRKLVVVGGPRGACVGVFDKKHPTQAHPWPTQKTLTS